MPTVSCIKEELERLIGKQYTDEEFYDFMMSYGMELDEIVEEEERHSQTPVKTYKIDMAANRGDLLCVEGVARALRVFLGLEKAQYFKVNPAKYTITVDSKVGKVRPYVVSAVIRNVHFTQRSYNSFIDHQDKLHQNVCRRRTLVAIGTHDLRKMDPSKITYTGEAPEAIKFTALNQTAETNGRELFEILKKDKKLGEYLGIIEDAPVWPVIRDARGQVLSLPPIINSEYSKIDMQTSDIFIDCTATDLQKAYTALNAVINGICMHSATPLEVEAVKVHYTDRSDAPLLSSDDDVVPHLEPHQMDVELSYIRRIVGVEISAEEAVQYLAKMSVEASIINGGQTIRCAVPFQRADVLHPIDLVEDVAIGFGYNRIAAEYSFYPATSTIGGTTQLYRLTENVRHECAACGYTEMLLFCLQSKEDAIFGPQPIELANAKTSTFTHGRSSLVPGLLRAANINQSRPMPLQLFELGEVFQLDSSVGNDTGATTKKRLAALYCGVTDGFASLHGLLDKVGFRLGTQMKLKREDDKLCYEGRRAAIYSGEKRIGWIGVPTIEVLEAYKVPSPVTLLEIDLE